jgi:hypothetical protein
MREFLEKTLEKNEESSRENLLGQLSSRESALHIAVASLLVIVAGSRVWTRAAG